MRNLMQRNDARAELFRELEAMPDFLIVTFSGLTPEQASIPGPPAGKGAFSPVEHCWHLADLERFGYGVIGVTHSHALEEGFPPLPSRAILACPPRR